MIDKELMKLESEKKTRYQNETEKISATVDKLDKKLTKEARYVMQKLKQIEEESNFSDSGDKDSEEEKRPKLWDRTLWKNRIKTFGKFKMALRSPKQLYQEKSAMIQKELAKLESQLGVAATEMRKSMALHNLGFDKIDFEGSLKQVQDRSEANKAKAESDAKSGGFLSQIKMISTTVKKEETAQKSLVNGSLLKTEKAEGQSTNIGEFTAS